MNFRKTLAYYLPHMRRHRWAFVWSLVFYGFCSLSAGIFNPLIYKEVIDTVAQPIGSVSVNQLWWLFGIFVLVKLSTTFAFRIGDYFHINLQSKMLKQLTDYCFQRLGKHSYSFFANTFVGSLVAKSKRFVHAYETLHDVFTFQLWMNGIALVSTLIVLLWLAPPLAAIFFAWLMIFVMVSIWFLKRKIPMDLEHATAQSTTSGRLADSITNILTMKMFASTSREQQGFEATTDDEQSKRSTTWNWANLQRTAQGVMVATVEISVIGLALYLWYIGSVTVGTVVVAQIYLERLFNMVWGISRQISRTMQALTDAKEMVDIFEQPLAVSDPANPEQCQITSGAIQIKDIHFRYEADQNPVFSGLTIDIPAGQKVGLVGHSGSGKSTLTKLLLRFADVQDGAITIDGQNIQNITQDNLRANISYVPQDPVLFHRSLEENIGYGDPQASQEQVYAAAADAHADEFITKLPDGYETLVGERGVKLSGGERQRVAIARAMLKNAPVLVLDEATSALDSISEGHIQAALHNLMADRTTLVIAHRLSTIQAMDRILVFEQGQIVEDGSHSELMAAKGHYYDLWQQQVSGFIE